MRAVSRYRPQRLPAAALLALMLLVWLPPTATAQTCQVTNTPTLDFGTVSATANTDAQTTVVVTCQGTTPFTNSQVTACVFIDEGFPPGVAPRYMSNDAGALMRYDLYSNPARTQLLGPTGGSQWIHGLSFQISGTNPQSITFNIYGRVPAGQALPAAYLYEGVPGPSTLRYSNAPFLLPAPTAENCRDGVFPLLGSAGQSQFFFGPVQARVADNCVINLASDLDFGTVSQLAGTIDQSAEIQMRCATDTAWSMTLDNGQNASNGQRRMAFNGNYIAYELYRDPARLIRWGDTRATGANDIGDNNDLALIVHGRVPAQPTPPAGSYQDTITVTLTY